MLYLTLALAALCVWLGWLVWFVWKVWRLKRECDGWRKSAEIFEGQIRIAVEDTGEGWKKSLKASHKELGEMMKQRDELRKQADAGLVVGAMCLERAAAMKQDCDAKLEHAVEWLNMANERVLALECVVDEKVAYLALADKAFHEALSRVNGYMQTSD